MRIQHNIMAMNAYRNYNINTSAVSKNLEKLSSGYRINRAGDDAAGLAISEKMRAQITGLEAATKNVKDGISLVKTAEGAMQEVQDMLNRMVSLATQSANGTYDNEVDRANLQKEVDQLNEEINRIADSANFNGIKLLDGSLQDKAATSVKVTQTGVDRMLSDVIAKGEKPYDVAGAKTVLDAGKDETAVKTAFTMDFSGMSGSIEGVVKDADKNELIVDVKIGDLSLSAKLQGTEGANATTKGALTNVTAANIMSAVYNVLKGSTDGGVTDNGTDTIVKIDGIDYTFAADGTTGIKFTMVNDPVKESETRGNHDVKVGLNAGSSATSTLNGASTVGTKVTTGVVAGGAVRANTVFKITADDIRDGAYIKLGDKAVTLKVGGASTTSAIGSSTLVDLTEMEEGAIDLNKALSKINGAFAGATTYTGKDSTNTDTTTKFQVGVSDTSKGYPSGLTVQRVATGTAADDAKSVYTTKEKLGEIFSLEYTKNTAATSALALQIGDTSDSYNQLRVSIGDIHAAALGIDKVNIGTQTGAQDAVNVIKNAINQVSSIRGTLGATQNRLEHTQNNLSVMRENIQDAESTIRDTDIAEEMMAYTKNNILVQSAQAMLAQANQIPQGVLQLLG